MAENRPRFIERQETARTPAEAQQRRATTMLSVGVVALLIGVLGATAGSAIALLIGVLGVALLVGGLVLRR